MLQGIWGVFLRPHAAACHPGAGGILATPTELHVNHRTAFKGDPKFMSQRTKTPKSSEIL